MSAHVEQQLQAYYHFHSAIYDATRWSFLFGRSRILRDLTVVCPAPRRILEVGCGTGRNVSHLCELYPAATVTGIDLSEDMLRVARKKLAPYGQRVSWVRRPYSAGVGGPKPFDLILFSYSLSMFNPGWQEAISAALTDLTDEGCVAVVDFHSSRLAWFRNWMGVNHVRMEGHLLPFLQQNCVPRLERVSAAYGGIWQYFQFVGGRRPTGAASQPAATAGRGKVN